MHWRSWSATMATMASSIPRCATRKEHAWSPCGRPQFNRSRKAGYCAPYGTEVLCLSVRLPERRRRAVIRARSYSFVFVRRLRVVDSLVDAIERIFWDSAFGWRLGRFRSPGSVRLDAGELDHLGPLFDVARDARAEFRRGEM